MIPLIITDLNRSNSPLQFGKAIEYEIFSYFLQCGAEVFLPAVDDDGIDALLKRPGDQRFVEVQIKAKSKSAQEPGLFAAISHRPRPDYWFIFYSESLNQVWVMTSEEFVNHASKNKSGSKNQNKYSINFGKRGTRFSQFKASNLDRILYSTHNTSIMTIFDQQNNIPVIVEDDCRRWALQKKEEDFFAHAILAPHVMCIGTNDPNKFVNKAMIMVDSSERHIAPAIEEQYGRPIILIDCSKLCKRDAIGELYRISKADVSKRPIVIITNITDIPQEDAVQDASKYVENLLLHGWKEEVRYFSNTIHGDFTIETRKYTILIPWDLAKREKIKSIWRASDGLAWMDDYEKDLAEWEE